MSAPDRHGPELAARLARVNPTAAFVAALALVLAGLFAPGIIGGGLLLLLAGALAALTATTWPVQPPAARTVRLLALTLICTVALTKIL